MAKKIQREAFRAWMAGLLFNIMASVYSLSQIKARVASLDRKSAESAVEKKKLERYSAFHPYTLLLLVVTHSNPNLHTRL